MDRLATHTNINSKYMQTGQAVDDGAAVLVRRFGLAVRIAPIEDHQGKKLLRIAVDVLNWPIADKRLVQMRKAMIAASNVVAEGAPLNRVFAALSSIEHFKDDVEAQRVFCVVERHVSWAYDMTTNQRRIDALPFVK